MGTINLGLLGLSNRVRTYALQTLNFVSRQCVQRTAGRGTRGQRTGISMSTEAREEKDGGERHPRVGGTSLSDHKGTCASFI